MLCVRNRFLFTTRLYEQGDGGANSILITQAKHFTLLVGNYSREGFNHPGPAYLYVQAIGEYLFQDLLHVVPTAWNAHMLSVFALDSAFVALAVGVVYGWTRSVRGAAACFAVFIAFAVAYPPIVNSDWMPYMYVPTYVVFLLAAASVVAGRGQDAWVFALSGWFLIHGQACFLLFVPVITVAVLAPCCGLAAHAAGIGPGVLPRAPPGLAPGRGDQRGVRCCRSWLTWCCTGRATSASTSPTASPARRAATACARWCSTRCTSGGRTRRLAVPVVGYAVALAVTWWLSRGPLRRFCLVLLTVNLVSSLAFLLYAAVGIDDLTEYYIGYFYWSAPLVVALVVVLVLAEAMRERQGRCWLPRLRSPPSSR